MKARELTVGLASGHNQETPFSYRPLLLQRLFTHLGLRRCSACVFESAYGLQLYRDLPQSRPSWAQSLSQPQQLGAGEAAALPCWAQQSLLHQLLGAGKVAAFFEKPGGHQTFVPATGGRLMSDSCRLAKVCCCWAAISCMLLRAMMEQLQICSPGIPFAVPGSHLYCERRTRRNSGEQGRPQDGACH